MFSCNPHFGHNDRDLLRAATVTRGWNKHPNKSQHGKLTLRNSPAAVVINVLFVLVYKEFIV